MKENLYIGYLNMAHRTDRMNHMDNQLAKVDLKAVRHRGKHPNEYDLNDPKVQVMLNRTPGAIGCHFGQVDIMKSAQAEKANAMVLEDDIIFCSDFQKRLSYIDNWTLDHEWDVIWLGATFHVPAFWHRIGHSGMPPDCSAGIGKDCEPTDDERMIRTYGAFSTYAYIVNKDSIQKVVAMLDDFLPKSIGIDYAMIYWQPRGLKAFSFVPGCCKQMDNQSDIGNGMTVFSGFSKLNGTEENSAYWWQDDMNDFDPKKFNFSI